MEVVNWTVGRQELAVESGEREVESQTVERQELRGRVYTGSS